MPFSRSRSIESMTRSAMSAPSRNAPDCQSIASTSVVLPWSTCATMATLRRSERVATQPRLDGDDRLRRDAALDVLGQLVLVGRAGLVGRAARAGRAQHR